MQVQRGREQGAYAQSNMQRRFFVAPLISLQGKMRILQIAKMQNAAEEAETDCARNGSRSVCVVKDSSVSDRALARVR